MTETVDELFKRLDEIAPAGYHLGFHIRFSRPAFFKMTYDTAWTTTYADRKLILCDPSIIWGLSNQGVARWSEVSLPDPLGVFKRAREFGLNYGAAVGCGPIHSKTLGSAARSDREFTDEEMREIYKITQAIHELTTSRTRLSKRQIDALQCLADGMTYDQACDHLNISRTALKSRLQNARQMLNVKTNSEAVKAATDKGILSSTSYTGLALSLPFGDSDE